MGEALKKYRKLYILLSLLLLAMIVVFWFAFFKQNIIQIPEAAVFV